MSDNALAKKDNVPPNPKEGASVYYKPIKVESAPPSVTEEATVYYKPIKEESIPPSISTKKPKTILSKIVEPYKIITENIVKEANPVTKTKDQEKKYIPQVKLVEEPEIPTTHSPPTTTVSPEKEARTYKPEEIVSNDGEQKQEHNVNPLPYKTFPKFFSRFQQIFGDTQTSFFVKL